jgi:hypothetical protein
MPAAFDNEFDDFDDFYDMADLSTSLTSQYLNSIVGSKWDDEDTWDVLPLDLDITLTNSHVWLVTLANFTFLNQEFRVFPDAKIQDLEDLILQVPELDQYAYSLKSLYKFLDESTNIRWLAVFKAHIFKNRPLSKVLLDHYRSFQTQAHALRNTVREELEKTFFPEYLYLKNQDFTKYLDIFTEWYLVKYNKDYPVNCKSSDISVEEEKWSFIEGHVADHGHFRMARALAILEEDVRISYTYALLAVQPKDIVPLVKSSMTSSDDETEKMWIPISATSEVLMSVPKGKKADARACAHEFIDADGVTICMKCQSILRGAEPFGIHYS